MCLLTEAIRVERKQFCNLEYHQARFDKTRRELLGLNYQIKLDEVIKIPENIGAEVYKCKIIYSDNIHSTRFIKYDKHLPGSIKLVYNNEIDYSFKYESREQLNLLTAASTADEIVIVKNGMITDTSRSNIVLSDGIEYVTPATFLLEGTKRKALLDKGIITVESISVSDLFSYEKLYLVNSMLDIEDQPGFPVNKIIK